MRALIFDLDQTLIDSRNIENLRRNGQWRLVYEKIPTISAYEGINEILSTAKKKGIKLAIVSSSPSRYVQRVLKYFGWSFDEMICYHDTTRHKPDPEPFLKIIGRLGNDAKDCWAIGDDPKDIIAAKAAGILTVAALWGSNDKESLLNAEPNMACETVASFHRALASSL